MRFYFPDSQDQIDPSFDFETEERSPFRIRQRDDLYAHEVLDPVALHRDARLEGDRRRRRRRRRPLQRPAAPAALPRRDPRVLPPRRGAGPADRRRWATAAPSPTCARSAPPYTVDEVIDFYEGCGFDAGLSVDHVVLGFELARRRSSDGPAAAASGRSASELTLELAAEFLRRHRERGCELRAGRRRAGMEPRLLRRLRRGAAATSATSASRSAASCR